MLLAANVARHARAPPAARLLSASDAMCSACESAAAAWRLSWLSLPGAAVAEADAEHVAQRLPPGLRAVWLLGEGGSSAEPEAAPPPRRKRKKARPPTFRRAAAAPAAAREKGARKAARRTGNAYIDACGEDDDDYGDLADFIVAKPDRDYRKLLERGGHLSAGAGLARPPVAAAPATSEEEEEEEDEA